MGYIKYRGHILDSDKLTDKDYKRILGKSRAKPSTAPIADKAEKKETKAKK